MSMPFSLVRALVATVFSVSLCVGCTGRSMPYERDTTSFSEPVGDASMSPVDTARAYTELAAFAWKEDAQFENARQSIVEALEYPLEEDSACTEYVELAKNVLKKDLIAYWYPSNHRLDVQPHEGDDAQSRANPFHFDSDARRLNTGAANTETSDVNLLFHSGPFFYQNRQTAGSLYWRKHDVVVTVNRPTQLHPAAK